jgi:hypothetical protein
MNRLHIPFMRRDDAPDKAAGGLPSPEEELLALRRSRRFVRAMLWVTACGVFLCAGQALRLASHLAAAREYREALHELYVSVLGPDPGASPFGRLQFERGKRKALGGQEVNVLGLLAALSQTAPQGLRIDSLNLRPKFGEVQAAVGSEAALEKYLKSLADNDEFLVSLARKWPDPQGGVRLVLRVEPR